MIRYILPAYRSVIPLNIRLVVREKLLKRPNRRKTNKVTAKTLLKGAFKFRHAMQPERALKNLFLARAKDRDNIEVRQLTADLLAEMGFRHEAAGISRDLVEARPLDLRSIKRLAALGMPIRIAATQVTDYLSVNTPTAETILDALRVLNHFSYFEDAVQLGKSYSPLEDDAEKIETVGSIRIEHAFAAESLNDLKTAIRIYDSIPVETKASGRAASGHARCLLELGMLDEAEAVLHRVGAFVGGPVPYNAVLQSLLYLRGDHAAAHVGYRGRKTSQLVAECFNMGDPRELRIKDPANKEKSALILAEGGPGDEIRFAAMYNQLCECFASVTLTCEPRLLSLFSRSFPNLSFIPVQRHRQEFITGDYADRRTVPDRGLLAFVSDAAMEAAHHHDLVFTTLDALTEMRGRHADFQNGARLSPRDDLVRHWEGLTSSKHTKIAISWRSLLQSSSRDRHYLKASDLKPLSRLKNAEFWLFQPHASDDEIATIRSILPKVRIPLDLDLKDDFENQAAFLSAMDYVISPLTTTAELAGMIGARTVLLSTTHISSWRKNADGSDAWYENGILAAATPIWDRTALMNDVVNFIRDDRLRARKAA